MEVTDLRVGNLIYVSYPDNPVAFFAEETIEKCQLSHLKDICNGSENWVYKPIHLTKELLIRLGFKWKNHGLRYSHFCIRKCGIGWMIFMSNEGLNFNIELKYVHQLQNLLYAINGTELELQPETE